MILKFDDFFGGVLATGTAAQLLGQFNFLVNKDANETDGTNFSFSVIPSLGLPDGSGIYFSNTGELYNFLKRSASPPAQPSPPPPPPPTPPAPYVSPQDVINLYEDECGRAPTPTEIANTQAAIANRSTTMQQLRISASTSPEVTNAIKACYNALVDRDPNSFEITATQQNFAGGGSLAVMRAGGSRSPECISVIQTCYQSSLNRQPSSTELLNTEGVLAGGGSIQFL